MLMDGSRVTAAEFLEFERGAPAGSRFELIAGRIRKKSEERFSSCQHSQATSRFSHQLLNWLDTRIGAQGVVADGEARCRIMADPETIVGLDVAYFEGEQHVHPPADQSWFEGPPVVAVEVVSSSDTHESIRERIQFLLNAGVKQVWLADPDFRTVTVHRAEEEPRMVSRQQVLSGGPELPGFSCEVKRLFPG